MTRAQNLEPSRIARFCAPTPRRPNPVFSEDYAALRQVLVRARRRSGLSQRALAARLGKSQSHVNLIERGQRRVDSLELYFIAKALSLRPEVLFAEIAASLEAAALAGAAS